MNRYKNVLDRGNKAIERLEILGEEIDHNESTEFWSELKDDPEKGLIEVMNYNAIKDEYNEIKKVFTEVDLVMDDMRNYIWELKTKNKNTVQYGVAKEIMVSISNKIKEIDSMKNSLGRYLEFDKETLNAWFLNEEGIKFY